MFKFLGLFIYLNTSALLDIFSQSITCLCILFTWALAEQMFLIFMKSNLSVFSSMDHAFGIKSRNSLPISRS